MLDSLRKTRSAYTRSRAPYSEVSWGKRVQQLSAQGVASVRTVVMFVLSVPSRVRGFIALSGEERGKVYAGWWAVAKKEARHYWVGCSSQTHLVHTALALLLEGLVPGPLPCSWPTSPDATAFLERNRHA